MCGCVDETQQHRSKLQSTAPKTTEEGQQQPQPLHHDEAEEAEEEEALALDHGGNASQAALGPVRWEAPESLRRKEYRWVW